MSTDTSEKGLETLIVRHMTGTDGLAVPPGALEQSPNPNGTGYLAGSPKDFDREHALDVPQLFAFLQATQPVELEKLQIANLADPKDINRQKFLVRLSAEIGKRGVIDVLRNGIKHGPINFTLFYASPSEGNAKSATLNKLNRFSLTRQLGYSLVEGRRALDLCLFINGLPIATFELKNSLTKQTVQDAVAQYQNDRDPREKLFQFSRCAVHFAVDDAEVRMCPELRGKDSWFLPFNKGWNDHAGNPPNPNGLKTAYLWEETLTPPSLTNILENYAQIIETPDPKTKKPKLEQVFPRYHQLDVVRKLLAHAPEHGSGERYLIQHSAGSGKSNSIAWLSHQLIGLKRDGKSVFDSVIVVTDRRILDDQIQKTIKHFMQVSSTVGHAKTSGDLRRLILEGKKIIISTVQKFPFIQEEINMEETRQFAIIIDEAHSSQGGQASSAMSEALGDPEDQINDALDKRMASHKMLPNASYIAFTATPKPKTLQMFGEPLPPDAAGNIKHRPFHSYTMKQAIDERFILDVLQNYTPVGSYYRLIKKIEEDPEFDTKKAQKKLRKYVEGHKHATRIKAEIMVDHFHDHVIALNKIRGKARAMIVCDGIPHAYDYFIAVKTYLEERKSPYKAIIAFSGEHTFAGVKVTESSLNGFASADIADTFKEDPYRFLICADKFQTGYDEPLLHTMYVDKPLSGIKAVQTLSRLNRAHRDKKDVFVLDFHNNVQTITEAFQDYYRTTILSSETDPNRLHDLKASLDAAQVYDAAQMDAIVETFLIREKVKGENRPKLDAILDPWAAVYANSLDENSQIRFKGDAKAFVRLYGFLGSILPYPMREWEKLSIALTLLIPKLPAPNDPNVERSILETVDMESYRVEKQAARQLALSDENAEIDPLTASGGAHGRPDAEFDRLSNIIRSFNESFGTQFEEADRVFQQIANDIIPAVAENPAYLNAQKNTPNAAEIELNKALKKAMLVFIKDNTKVYKLFTEDESFAEFLRTMVRQYSATMPPPTGAAASART